MSISIKSGIFKYLLFILLFMMFFYDKAQSETYSDSFSDGKAQLEWNFFPHFFLDNLEAIKDTYAPDGDGGVGVLRNANMGGFAALSYAVTEEVSNFTLQSYVFCPVTDSERGPLSGLAFLIDPVNSRFYRFICDFNNKKPNLNLAYIGRDTRHFPVYLKFWREKEIPGGSPKKSGWHRMKIKVKNGKAQFFWNDIKLGGEYNVSRINRGFVGVYANFVGGLGVAETRVDSFTLIGE